MKVNKDIINNSVSAQNQVKKKVKFFERDDAQLKILFLGNSITLHEIAPSIGWNNDWGMAASKRENDYVHVVVSELEKAQRVSYSVCNVSDWEWRFYDEGVLSLYKKVKDFNADVVIVRLGENVSRDDLAKYDFAFYLKKFIEYFVRPETKLVITDTFWEYEPICKAEEKVAKALKADFVSISDLGYKNENKAIGEYAHAGVASHPNDTGMRRIAERILSKLM
ncbi:MAG: SGNH/GDSL hydrolase family protein [Clostridia bacterium]|nr:SGNH/GDSL hydrolase family protein [Clostridia bacterium]